MGVTSGEVDPSIGLLISHFRLLEKAETKANTFPDRHIDFYYRDVLGQKPNKATAETVLLRFQPSTAQTVLNKDRMILGSVAGTEISKRYRLLDSVRVVPAKVEESRILVFDRDPAISNQRTLGFVTGVRADRRAVDGTEKSERAFAPSDAEKVALGLDIQSQVLSLSEGRREITVTIEMKPRNPVEFPEILGVEEGQRKADGGGKGTSEFKSRRKLPSQKYRERLREAVYAILRENHETNVAFTATQPSKTVDNIFERVFEMFNSSPIPADPRRRFYRACLEKAKTSQQVSSIYGRIVTETLVESKEWPKGTFRKLIVAKFRDIGLADPTLEIASGLRKPTQSEQKDQDAAADVLEWFDRAPSDILQEFLNGAFRVSLSTAEGPLVVDTARAIPIPHEPKKGEKRKIGFALRLVLDESVPAIVGNGDGEAPALHIRMDDGSFFCPFSLFEPYAIDQVTTKVRVKGLTRLTGYSDEGALDLSQPFMPFGAAPKDKSTFIAGSREMAIKPVTHVTANLQWANLPAGPAGFLDYYEGYGEDFEVPNPQLAISYLQPDGWKPLANHSVPLTQSKLGLVGLNPERSIEGAIPGRPVAARSGTTDLDFLQRNRIRAGMIKIELDCPGDAFGHAEYPAAMSRALRPTLIPFWRRTVPSVPFTPEIASITMDYTAVEVIDLDAPQAARPDQRLTQITPFGKAEVFPNRYLPGAGLFARRLANGCLFFRIDGDGISNTLSILFEMERSSHKRISFTPPSLKWFYMTAQGWSALPEWSVASDSTDGLMRSGVVRLRLPDDAATQSSLMPGQGAWVAICIDKYLGAFPKLRSVTVNGARAIREDETDDPADKSHQPTDWFLEDAEPGVAAIERIGNTIEGCPAEKKSEFRVRVSERLRHRNRGIMAWDIERLALSRFPEIWKAKCFPTLDRNSEKAEPGAVTLIAVPYAPEDAGDNPAQQRMFDVLTLRRIQAELKEHCSPFTKLDVANPSFERLQVRARVGFKEERDDGSLMQQLKLDISRYLSVWTADAPMNGFGWSTHLNDVGAFMANRDYVEFFSELSLLQLVGGDDERYTLYDTAHPTPDNSGTKPNLTWSVPWALPLPMEEHWIVPTREKAIERAGPTGIGGLVVGQNLVIDRDQK